MSEVEGDKVQLYVYDLSQGMARQMSQMLLGVQLEGIWHTAVVVGGWEYYYGQGIQQDRPGTTPFGRPLQVIDMGVTQVPEDIRDEFLIDISARFGPESYSLLRHNCNHFSNEFAMFLVGKHFPDHITALPSIVAATPLGQQMMPFLTLMETQMKTLALQGHSFHPAHPHHSHTATATATPVPSPSAASLVPPPASSFPSTSTSTSTVTTSQSSAPKGSTGSLSTVINTVDLVGHGLSSGSLSTTVQEAELAVKDLDIAKDEAQPGCTANGTADGGDKAGTGPGTTARSSNSQSTKADFEAALKVEFSSLMAQGKFTPNEAAALALQKLKQSGTYKIL